MGVGGWLGTLPLIAHALGASVQRRLLGSCIHMLAPTRTRRRLSGGGRSDDAVALRLRLDKAERAVEKERRAAQDLQRQLRDNAQAASEGREAQQTAVELRHR